MAAYASIQDTVYEYAKVVKPKYKYTTQYVMDACSPITMNCKGIIGNAIAYHTYVNNG